MTSESEFKDAGENCLESAGISGVWTARRGREALGMVSAESKVCKLTRSF
jgi:hypothetical protein